MTDWLLENGLLLLKCKDGNLFHPCATELYRQKDLEYFSYMGNSYESLSSLKLRFSDLLIYVKVEFTSNVDDISMSLFYYKNSIKHEIPIYNYIFDDYVICDGVCKHADYKVSAINNELKSYAINPLHISYKQYVMLLGVLSKLEIEINDNINDSIKEIKNSREFEIPLAINASLYSYQFGGTKWLDFMIRQGCGCILGDEMGLGKTLQIIATMGLYKVRNKYAHFLVVCPVSLLENWRREINKFYPSLSVNIHHSSARTGDYRILLQYDVNIMSYNCCVADNGLLSMINWDLFVIDEAQNIKNPHAKRTKAIKQIKCNIPIAVTGTPFENHMTDIWSLVDFVMPGYLGNLLQFEKDYIDDIQSASLLEKLITPLILRRRVKDVARDLPERIDIPQIIEMTDEEAMLYENNRVIDNPQEELKSMQLAKIQKLRTFCTHPFVYNSSYQSIDPILISNKYKRLCEILEEIFESKEKVIIFTSFRKMIDLLVADVKDRFNVFVDFIDGSIEASERQNIVDKFSFIKGSAALILNPKAAGTGLNITSANHVIHYNLEWNPAVEDQASARVYRRGQHKTVFVHRLFYANTIEEIINEKIVTKRELADNAIIGNKGNKTDQEYLLKALSLTPYKKVLQYEEI